MKRKSLCDGNHPSIARSGRREFMYVGLAGGLGLTLPNFLRLQAAESIPGIGAPKAKATGVIHIYLPGGMAHQESWDPKPYASSMYRGPLGTINTKIAGEKFGQMFKNVAAVSDKVTVIRSMTHGEAAHERGTHNMFTGYRPSPAIKYPSMGTVVNHELGSQKDLPPYVCIPNVPNEFAGTGYLSTAYGPFGLGADPAQGGFKVRDLNLPGGVDAKRFERRKGLLATVDSHFKSLEESDALDAMDSFYQRAYGMISSKEAREAFNLEAEDAKLRDEYGRNQAGQRMILARRLVESGVRFVSLTYGGWDHHNNIKGAFEGQAPPLDQALARLIRDLDDRGMLDSTIVMVTSEFGRTPKINPSSGRDHWPRVFSVLLAGGGLKKGAIYGSSDGLGGMVENDPVSPEDLAYTVYYQMGIDPEKRLIAPGDRPIDIIRGGRLIKEIIA